MSDQTALNDKIIRQVEYYFGDVNLNKDKFMQEEVQKDSGWVQLDTLIKFNRLKSLSTDFAVITSALKASTSGLLEIDEENKKVRRAKSLPENLSEFETNLKQNTVYVKGFPATLTLDELYAFFEAHGKVLQIFMRRFPSTKQFKGSVFVTFETKEQVSAFMELAELKHADQALIKETQAEYIKRKGPKLESFLEAKKKKEQQKEEKEKQKKEAEEAFLKEQQVDGAILHIKGVNEEGTRENIKELFDNFASVKFIDYSKGLPEAYVRFAQANTAKSALEGAAAKAEGTLTLRGATLEARVLEGEEEAEYWRALIRKLADIRAQKKSHSSKRGGARGGNKGGDNRKDWSKGKGKKRSLDGDNDADDKEEASVTKNDAPAAENGGSSPKKVKTEEA